VRARSQLKQAAFDRLSVAATLKEGEISRWFEDQERDFFLTTQFPEVKAQLQTLLSRQALAEDSQAAYDSLSEYLKGVAEVTPNFNEIFILDRGNRAIVSTEPSNEGQYVVAGNFTYFDFEQMESRGPVAPLFYISPVTGKPTVTFAAPLRDARGQRIGAILAHLNLERIDRIVRERTGLGDSGETYLVGSVVAAADFIAKSETQTQEFPDGVNSVGIEAAMRGQNGSQLYRNYAGVPVIGVYRWLEAQDIALLVEMEQAEALTPARQLAVAIIAVGLAAAGGLSVGVYWLSRQITRPLLAIARVTTQVAAGDLERVAPVLTEDEVGLLARNFNRMTAQLKASFATLEAKNKELQRLDQLKDEFLANTSHELRTPLNGIIGIAETLMAGATGELSPKTRLNLAIVAASGRRLSNLVNDILDFSKLRHQDIELQLRPVGVRAIAEIVLALSQPLVGTKDLQLLNTIPEDLPLAQADENRLQQIFYNLIGNAIKFTEAGAIEVSAALSDLEREGRQGDKGTRGQGEELTSLPETRNPKPDTLIEITVRDTGIGIPKEKRDRIFESFEQADGSTAREYGGTGLGLAVTKKLVELHSGLLTVESTPGEGSTFTFTLPIASEQSAPVAATGLKLSQLRDEPTPLLAIADSSEPSSIDPKLASEQQSQTILIVDDEPVNRQVFRNYLSLANYAIAEASSGPEALAMLENGFKPDLILLDVMMPRRTGYEVTKKIRATWNASELPIILLTAKNQVSDLVVGLEVGANDYLTKPIAKDELLARIKTHLNLRQLTAENLHLATELDITRKLQQMLLPREEELAGISGLDLAGFMEPAEEVGGDYYDILQAGDRVKISIGDVTGHGLESGVLAIMVQTAVRTLLAAGETDSTKFLAVLNRTIYDNVRRMNCDKTLTLSVLDYHQGNLRLSGQHEEAIVVRTHGEIERIDTLDLGFPIGLDTEIDSFVAETPIQLLAGDLVILYTDGITEAENTDRVQYGVERLCEIVRASRNLSAGQIKQAVIDDLRQYIGEQKVYDDITLVVLKQQ